MTDRLPQACRAFRVTRAGLVDAVCELSGRPVPPWGAHVVGWTWAGPGTDFCGNESSA